MYPSREARELGVLLRISRELDICGDVTATVDDPSELLAWAAVLSKPRIRAWRAQGSGHRFFDVTADHRHAPVRGRVAAVLDCETHAEFWAECGLEELEPGEVQALKVADLARAWERMPITPPDAAGDAVPSPEAGRMAARSDV